MRSDAQHEEGYEIASGKHAQEFWYPKRVNYHQCWEDGKWCRVGGGTDFHPGWTYRRPVTVSVLENHFI
jgi:hypothetical protein